MPAAVPSPTRDLASPDAQPVGVGASAADRPRAGATAPPEANAVLGGYEHQRFVARASALLWARAMFLGLGLFILALPEWSASFGLWRPGPTALGCYLVVAAYSVANHLVLRRPLGRVVTYVTLCLDLLVMVVLIARSEHGGLKSPLLATQLLFTTLFALLFPKPLGILPPLLALPVLTRLDLLLEREVTARELLTVIWFALLNVAIVYVVTYLHQKEAAAHREVLALQAELKDLAVVEERSRLAREIHDGVGASLSSVILQAEYLSKVGGAELRADLGELKATAEESMEELRRSVRVLRDEFDFRQAMEDAVHQHGERLKLAATFLCEGQLRPVRADIQLALLRVLQEALANVARHARAQQVVVRLACATDEVTLRVEDDGQGFSAEAVPPGHFGLSNMRERARALGGELTVDSAPGAGFRLTFTVPARS